MKTGILNTNVLHYYDDNALLLYVNYFAFRLNLKMANVELCNIFKFRVHVFY